MKLDPGRFRRQTFVVGLALVLVGAMPVGAQTPTTSPQQLVRETVRNEIAVSNGGARFMFTDRKTTPHGTQTKLMVETNGATAGMMVAIDDKALTSEQREAEEARLKRQVQNPEELRKKQKSEKEDAEHVTRIVKALPEAFLYEREGMEPGRLGVGKVGDELVRLKFRPNPEYEPPSHVEQVLTGMQGTILIDSQQRRIARIDATLIKDVGFGWGILGHLDKGGRFMVEQGDVGGGEWDLTRMNLAFAGKILVFKSLNIRSEEVFSDFRPAPPNLDFAQGVELLLKQAAELAQNGERAQ